MAIVRSDRVRDQIIYYAGNRKLWCDAIGPNVAKWMSHFISMAVDDSTGDPTEWTCTMVEVGSGNSTMSLTDATHGVVKLEAAGNENDGVNAQLGAECFKLEDNRPLYFGCRWTLDEATQSDAFVGLGTTDATFLAGVPNDFLGFIKHDGDANLDFQAAKDGTGSASDTTEDLTASTYVVTEFYWDGSSAVYAYVDGTLTNTVTSNIPDDEELRPTLAYLNGAAQASKGLHVDWLRIIQITA